MDCAEVRKVDSGINVRLVTRLVCAGRSLVRVEYCVGYSTHDYFTERGGLADALDTHGVNELPIRL